MKKATSITIFASALCMLLSLGTQKASADSYTVDYLNDNSSTSAGGEPVGPYAFTLTDTTTNTQFATSLMCIDLNDEIAANETWAVTIATAGQLGTPYEETAYLNSVVTANQGKSNAALAQWAAWYLFDPSNSVFTTGTNGDIYAPGGVGDVTAELATAASAVSSNPSLYSSYEFFQPTSNTSGWTNGLPQTLVGDTNFPVSPTPEPSTLLMLGAGLLGLAFIVFRTSSQKDKIGTPAHHA